MKLSLIFFSLLLLLLVLPQSDYAFVSDGTPVAKEIVAPLAEWVEDATYVHFKTLPMVVASNSRLRTALDLQGVQKATLNLKGMQKFNAAAAYLPGQIIVNSMIWYPNSKLMQSYIVHELVHHAQLLSLKKYPCNAAKEREAYTLQNEWLVEHGEKPLVSQKWIEKVSSCVDGDGEIVD